MRKIVEAEKLKPLLLYTENFYFLKQEEPFPYNEREILQNLCERMNGTTPDKCNSILKLSVSVLILVLSVIAPLLLTYGIVSDDNPYKGRYASLGMVMLIGVALAFLVGGGIEIFKMMIYSPRRLTNTYETFKQDGTAIKGILVQQERLGHDCTISYLFTSPRSGGTIKKTYRSNGETPHRNSLRSEVIVWYYSDAINALL